MLYVPTGSKAAYEAVDPWRNFWDIEEMDFSGIVAEAIDGEHGMQLLISNGTVTVSGIDDHDVIEVFDAQGRSVYRGMERTVANLPRGIYIVKSGTASAKFSM